MCFGSLLSLLIIGSLPTFFFCVFFSVPISQVFLVQLLLMSLAFVFMVFFKFYNDFILLTSFILERNYFSLSQLLVISILKFRACSSRFFPKSPQKLPLLKLPTRIIIILQIFIKGLLRLKILFRR